MTLYAPDKHAALCQQGLSARAIPGQKTRKQSCAFSIPGVDVDDDEQEEVHLRVRSSEDRESEMSELSISDEDEGDNTSFTALVFCTIFAVIALGMWLALREPTPIKPLRSPKKPLKPVKVPAKDPSKGKNPDPPKEPEAEKYNTMTGLSPTMQNCVFAGGAAIPVAGGAYWYKKYRDRKRAEATVAGKIKSKVGKKGFYAVCAVVVTAVGGALLAFFQPKTYMNIFNKLPECLQFSFLNLKKEEKDKKKPSEPDEEPPYLFTDLYGSWIAGSAEDNKWKKDFKNALKYPAVSGVNDLQWSGVERAFEEGKIPDAVFDSVYKKGQAAAFRKVIERENK